MCVSSSGAARSNPSCGHCSVMLDWNIHVAGMGRGSERTVRSAESYYGGGLAYEY